MKLIYRILIHLSLALPIILAAWGILFYMAIIDEVNDEVDDSLEDYSEVLITGPWQENNYLPNLTVVIIVII